MKRNRVLALALAGVVGSGVVGWVAGTRVQSSNEAAAAADPPDASAVTAAVKKQALSSNIVTRGTAKFGEPSKVSLAAGSGGAGLVTKAPEAGLELDEGTPFMEVNGLPVFALEGGRPMYRDLGPGDSGEDVRQLEEALARLGFDPGAIDGVYDGATASAIDRWFAAAGYTAEGPTDAERSELRSAATAVDQAQSALANAKRQLNEGTKPPTELDMLQAESEVRQAQDALAGAKLKATDGVREAEREVTAKYNAVQAAKDKAIADEKQAQRNVDDKYAAAQLARANLSELRSGGSSSKGTGGGASAAAILQAEQAVKRADQELADAREARDKQPAESAKAVADAESALSDARAALPRAKSDGETAIRNAETALSVSTLKLTNLREPKTSESLNAAVRDAETALAKAQTALAETQSVIGVKVRATSIVFFPSLPLRIDSVKVARGDAASGEVMTVSGANLVVDGSVTIADAKLLSVGMEVQIDAPDLAISLKGRISRVSEKPGTDGVDNQHVYIEIEPIDPPANFRDAAVKLTIPVKSTAGDVLVVPVAAISSNADGSARVEVADENGQRRELKVTPGLSAQGLVEVTPLDGELRAGDRVVVGAQ